MSNTIRITQFSDTAKAVGYERSIRSIEGDEDISPGGTAWLYEMPVTGEHTLRVENSMSDKTIRRDFSFAKTNNGIRIDDVANSAISEFNNVGLTPKKKWRIETTILERENFILRPSNISYSILQ